MFDADDTLWTGAPDNYTSPKARTVLSKVRDLVDMGRYSEATCVAYGLSGERTQVHNILFCSEEVSFFNILVEVGNTFI